MSASEEIRRRRLEGAFFIGANIAAGLLHYLYQVVAARRLSAADFADLNAWYAALALFFAVAGFLQYTANFAPAKRRWLRAAVLAANLLAAVGLWRWFESAPALGFEHAVWIVLLAAVSGWLLGQAQIRLAFTVMAIASLVIGATKLATALWPAHGLTWFALAPFAGYIPALWWLSVHLWRADDTTARPRARARTWWTAPLILSTASAVFPQLDLVLMSHTQTAAVFTEFAQASLFYKAIYFLVALLAQWLLPQQIHGLADRPIRKTGATLAVAVVAAVAASAVLAAIAAPVAHFVLGWAEAPRAGLVFVSCLNMSLLTLLFLFIQEACARSRTRIAALTLAVIGAEAAVQLLLNLEAFSYYALVLAVQTLWLVALARRRRPNR
jgi:hypothetical protein